MIVFGVSVSALVVALFALDLLSGGALSTAAMAVAAFVLTYVLLGAFKVASRLRTLLGTVSVTSLVSHPGFSSCLPWEDFDLARQRFEGSAMSGFVKAAFGGRSPSAARPVPDWLGEALVESYARWREESISVNSASMNWLAGGTKSVLAHATYAAALDREEAAARDYAQCTDLIRRLCA